jgi:7-cyano-7-deazaguanine synthase
LKSVVLLSGGLDSATNLYIASQKTDVRLALTFNYGQRVAQKEVHAAKELTQRLGINHKVLDISWIKDFGRSSLIDRSHQVPQGADVKIDDQAQSKKTATAVWVPNRNGILLNIAAGYAEAFDADIVVPGFNIEEAQTFPDNSEAFLEAMTASLSFSTANKVKAQCFTTNLDKTGMVRVAHSLSLPFELLWSCYLDGEKWCGTCESCLRFKRALINNDLLKTYQNKFVTI